MNNIKMLEDYIEALRNPKSFKYTNEQKAQAIENLIKENKELKDKCNELNFKYTAQWVDDNFIPKSKVKELAKKYEFALNGYDSSTADYKHSQNLGKYLACLELLEERK